MTRSHLTRHLARSTCALAASACIVLALASAAPRVPPTAGRSPSCTTARLPTVVKETVLRPADGGPDTLVLVLIGIGAAAALLGAGYLGARIAIRAGAHGGQASGTGI